VTDLIGGRRGIPKHNGTTTFRRGQIPIESPTNLVQRGNSDPFDTYAIPVDPMVNGLLSFYRDSVMPTMFQGPVAARAANAGWMDCVDSLEDKGSAFGFLARCSAAAVIVAPNTDMASQAFIYQARSMASLRSVLAGGAPVRSFRTYSQINMYALDTLQHSRFAPLTLHVGYSPQRSWPRIYEPPRFMVKSLPAC
jgi:hypothetical protein